MRVVAHSCSNTELICALGQASLLVGVDAHSDYPPAVVGKLPTVGTDLELDIDRIVALQPDLVVLSDTVPGHERNIEALQATNLDLLILAPQSLADVATDMRTLARALGCPATGEELASEFLEALDALSVAATGSGPPILVEWWPKPVIAPGRDSWVTELLQRAGARNPWAADPCASRPVTTEEVVAAAPEVIVMSWCGVQEAKYRPHIVARRPGWTDIPAVRQGRIVPITEAWLGRPGPRLIDGLRALRAVVAGL